MAWEMEVKHERRLCVVGDKYGYFHAWEHFSQSVEASLLVGGAPAGVFSRIYGIVEFTDGVKRVEITDIYFCDEENEILRRMEDKNEKDTNIV